MATTPQTFTWDDQEQKPPEQAGGFKWDDSSAPAAAAPAQPAQAPPVKPQVNGVGGDLRPLTEKERFEMTYPVGRPGETVGENVKNAAQNVGVGIYKTIAHPIQTAESAFASVMPQPLVDAAREKYKRETGQDWTPEQQRLAATQNPTAGIYQAAQNPGEQGAQAVGQAIATAGAAKGYGAMRAGLAARLGKGASAAAPVPEAATAPVAATTPPPAPEVVAPSPEQPGGPSGPGGGPAPAPPEPRPQAGSTGSPVAPQQPAGLATQAAQPGKPTLTLEHEPSLLDQVAAHTEAMDRARAETAGASPGDIKALRDAVEETGRRAHDAGDMDTAQKAAHADIALSQILEDAIRATNEKGSAAPPPGQAANLNAAAAALTGKPISDVASANGGFKWDDQKPAEEAPKPVTPEKVAAILGTAKEQRPVVQASSNPEQIQKSAQEQKPALKEMAAAAVVGVPGAKVEGARVKDAESVANKEDRGKPPETITDHLGGRMSAPTPEAVQQVQQNIEQNLPVVGKDQIDTNGLKATQYAVQTGKPGDANQQSELQVVTTDQAKAMKDTDPLYEKQKEALARGDQKEADRLGAQIKEHFDAAQQSQPAAAPLPDVIPKGTRVQLQDGRTGTVQWYDRTKQVARVKRDDGKEMPMVPRKALQAAPAEQPDSNQGAKQEVGQPAPSQNQQHAGGVAQTAQEPVKAGHPDTEPIGNPIPSRVKQIKDLLAQGTDVRIFSARVANDHEGKVRAQIEQWSEQNLGRKLPVTNAKDDNLAAILDDKANVEPNANTPFDIPAIPKGKWLGVDLDKTLALEKPTQGEQTNGNELRSGGKSDATTESEGSGNVPQKEAAATGASPKPADAEPAGTAAAGPGKEEAKPLGGAHGEQGSQAHAADEVKPGEPIHGKDLAAGMRVRVTKIPPGSYLTAGEEYTIPVVSKSGTVQFKRDGGAGTMESRGAVRHGEYTLLARPPEKKPKTFAEAVKAKKAKAAKPEEKSPEQAAIEQHRAAHVPGEFARLVTEHGKWADKLVRLLKDPKADPKELAETAAKVDELAPRMEQETGDRGGPVYAADFGYKKPEEKEHKYKFGNTQTAIPPSSDAGSLPPVGTKNLGSSVTSDTHGASSPAPKAVVNGVIANTHELADFLQSPAFKDHGFDGLDVPSQRIVMGDMIAALHQFEVRDHVIKLVPVDVVDRLIGVDDPSKVLLHDQAMLGNARISNLKDSVTIAVNVADTLAAAIAKVVAKLPSRSLDSLPGTNQGSPAVTAVNSEPRAKVQSLLTGAPAEVNSALIKPPDQSSTTVGTRNNPHVDRIPETPVKGTAPLFSPGQPVRISGDAVRDDEGTIKKFAPAAENHGFNTAVIIRPDGNETRVSWAEGRESPLRAWEEGKAPPRKAAPSPAEKAKVRAELAELERKREEVRQQYEKLGYYSEGGKDLSNQNVELTKQIFAKEDELAKLNGEPTRDERKAMQEQAAATPFDQRPAQAMKYDQPQQSQHWQVMEPDYANRRFEQQVAQYERAVTSDAAEVENAKAGTKAYDKAQAALDWRRAILKRLKDRDDKIAQQYKHEYLELVKKAISKGSPVPDSVIAQYSEFRTALDARERYEKGRHTSFANRSAAINDTMQKEEGFKAKRQDGKAITDAQVKEIKDGIADIATVLGADLRDMMRGTDLTIAHTNGKHPFLSDAGGMYHPGEKSISAGIDNWLGQPVRALAHEVGHWFDYESGKVMGAETKIMRGGKRVATAYASEADADKLRYAGYGTRAESLYSQALKTMTDTREVTRMLKVTKLSDLDPEARSQVERTKVVLGHYWREPREIFARLFEQYISEKLGRGGLASETPELYHTTPGWWDKDAWAKLEPMVEAEVNKRLAAMRERYAPKAPEATLAAASAPAAEPMPVAKPKDWAATVKVKKEAPAAPRTITGQDGKSTTLLTPSRELPATYRLIEADDLQPSHNAHTFAKNPTYPEGLQERAYDTSKEAQNRVIQQAQNYDPRYTVNTNPDAVNGPPVITPTGIVLGGNSRAMSTQRFYANGGDSYRAALKESASTYGFTPEQVDAMKKPVLVRQVENPSTPDDARRLGSELNKSMTGAMGVAERAVSAGKNIKADTLRNVAAMMQADDSTLREAMGKHGSEIVKMLTADGVITERERPQFVDTSTGGLSEEGKTFVERALMGTVIDDPRLMDAAPKSVLQKLERSLGSITSFASRADEWNLLPAIREAVAELGAIQHSGSTVDLRLGQTSLFGGERNSLVDAMIRALDGKPTAIRKAFDDYARDADQNLPGQARMFGEANAFDAFNASFGSTLTEQEYYDGLESAATKAPDATAGTGAQGDGGLFEGAEGNAPRSGGIGEAPGKLTPSDLGTVYSGGFLDPALFKRLFPDIAERTAQWAGDTVTPGDDQRAMMRETRGRMDRRVAIAIFKLRDAAKDWRTRPRAESIEFWNAVEEGRIASLAPKDQALAQVFKAAFGQMRGDLQKLKPEALQNYIENYFPHIWERSSQVTSTIKGMLNGKKPFAGKGGFLKRRTIPTMQDGLDLGFVPKSWNPVDLFVLKYAEMAQFLMGHQTLQVMKESGTAKFVRLGQKAPDGWTQLDDKIGTVHRRVKVLDDDKLDDVTQPLTYPGGKRKIPGAFSEDIEDATHGELALVGHYYAPADAARVFNNFVSRGIAGRSSIYDTLRWLNDNLNGLQLGISAFHATVTTVNAAASDIALGIEQLMQGKPVKAGVSMVSGAAILPTLYRTIRNGSRLMREYLSPGSHAKMEKEADAFAEAGGRVKQNTIELKPLDKAINAFRNGAFLEGLSAVPGALLHAAVAPVMDYYVPRMKVGAFYGMAHNILDEAQRKNWTPELTRARLQEAWDSIDDRFGQVVYDNLFWHKALRDTLHLAVRAVGYTFGDIRTYGGAVKDTAKAAVQIGRGKKPRVTPRMAFAVGSFISTALLGGVMTLAWTGHAPQTWKDYTHPMDNAGQRHTIPGYPDQMISAAHDPIQWSLNKVAPIWSAMAEVAKNTDFNHTEIRHKDDPAIQQLAEVAEWAIKQPIPFSFSNTGKLLEDRGAMPTLASMLQEAKEHPGDIALGNLGFTPAPSFVQHSEALNKAYTYERENMPPGTKTKEQAERQQAMHSLRSMFASGKVDRQKIAALKAQGVVNERDLLKARLTSKTDPLVRVVKSLTPEQALNVWNVADAKERKELRSTIEEKSRDIYTKIGNPEKRRELQTKYREALRPTFQVRPGSA